MVVSRKVHGRGRRQRVVLGIALASLVGCGGSSLPGPEYAAPAPVKPGEATEVPYPPPPARVEFIPKLPRSDAVWVDGEWTWTGRRWAWTYGRWVVPPALSTYAPWRTARTKDGALLFVPGTWYDAKGAPIAGPAPLATATARERDAVSSPAEAEKAAPSQVPAPFPAPSSESN